MPDSDPNPDPNPDLHPAHDHTPERVQRLEEQQAFADRAADQLSLEVYELNRRMHKLGKRMDALESRFDDLLNALDQPESGGDPAVDQRPPHSAGRPGIDR